MILLVFLVMVTYIPALSLWLPNAIDAYHGYK